MSYTRVIPRDLFNEANLLKCIGQLVLLIEEGRIPGLEYEYTHDAFDIRQNPADGSIWVANISFSYGGNDLSFSRALNARNPYPLYEDESGSAVFDDEGNFILNLEELTA